MIRPPIAISGKANIEILNSQNPKYHTISPVAVEPIFAPTRTPTALTRVIIPALTNPRVNRDTSVLLFSIQVIIVPTKVAFHHLLVYCCRI